MGAIIQLTREYLSKEAGRMGGCGHRIGYSHIFTTSPLKLCRGVIFGSVTVSSDVKSRMRLQGMLGRGKEEFVGDEVKEMTAQIQEGGSHGL